MESNIRICSDLMTRKKMANPFADISMLERLQNAKSIDLRNNCYEEILPNGYTKIIPIDKNKTY
ncbi:hypothetical protein [Paenibacillus tianjinensis]|uniref:Uncharacterized protein n=1 Tax=Paenibacillus tianjinensis TaxID=2810347 RepID=A0ABX7L895_9BACL|nr:hypothetical protein [Paenibacillus tianjinensis]QSF43571.1 hypothetical protein JRJ22_20125 [Paenibacillus tianjinensis]